MKETSKTPNRDALIDFIKKLTPAEIEKICKHKRLLEVVGRSSENEVVFLETLAEKLLAAQKSA
jgi:hypothetical protein